jgi:crotonobetainyl-CoA:carnitine CoA-transferase CaiB-like acyl-CoA transferase
MKPLDGIKVLDFGTLLPGPLATLILAEAGAEVIKIERPGDGDAMRGYVPRFGGDSVNFALLNRGKRSVEIDLKAPKAMEQLTPLIREADIVVEQFRAGVIDRLGFGYDSLMQINPRIIFASITGYGQSGPDAEVAAHDLNFCAQAGVLSLTAGSDGAPVLPAVLVADIAGGTYPAVINILLALRQRDRTGRGCKLDIAMAENLFTFLYWAMGNGLADNRWPLAGNDLLNGGSPRYHIYRTADDRFLAAAPLEDKFWNNFCSLIGLDLGRYDEAADPRTVIAAVAALIRLRSAEEWHQLFIGRDVCCNVVATVQEAFDDAHFRARGVFHRSVTSDGKQIPALPVPVVPQFRHGAYVLSYPSLGEANDSILAATTPAAGSDA